MATGSKGAAGEWTRRHAIVDGTLVLFAAGWPDGAFGDWVDAGLQEALASNAKVSVAFDLGGVDNYQSEARTRVTEVLVRSLPKIDRLLVFSRSKVVLMGASVASLALGGRVKVFGDQAAFERELSPGVRRALARLRVG